MTNYEKLGKALMRVVETVLPESYIEMSELSADQLEKAAETYCHMVVLNPHYGCVAESIPDNPDTVVAILKDLKTRPVRDFLESKASEAKKARKEVLEYLEDHPVTIDLAKDGLEYYLAPSAIEKCAAASNSLDVFKRKIETKIKEDDYYITSTYGDVLDHFESFDYDILSTDQIATMVKKNIVFNLKGLDKEAFKWFN